MRVFRRVVLLICAGAIAAAPASGQESGESGADRAAKRLGVNLSGGEPMSIASESLEVVPAEAGGSEKVVFTTNVKVVQGDMSLYCDWLEAIYPEGTGQGRPDRITARGNVRIVQAGSEALCSEAVFDNTACRAECSREGGRALLRRGDDEIEADVISFDLCNGVVKAKGGAVVRVRSSEEKSAE